MAKQALPGKRLNAFGMDPEDLVIIGLDTEDGSEHPRWDERVSLPLKEETVLNIMALGVQEAVKVVKVDGKPEVVNGRRRTMHAREANQRLKKMGEELVLVPVMLAKGDDNLMEELGISLNAHREDDSLMTNVDKCVRMLGRNGDNVAKTANAFGVTTQTIRNWVKIAGVSSKVRKAIDDGAISASAAAKLAPLPRAEQDEELGKLTANGKKATTRTADAAARGRQSGEEAVLAPTKRVQRKVVEAFCVSEVTELEPEFIRGVRWAIGDLAPESVKGLKAILNEL